MKKIIAILVALSLFTVLTAASCGGSGGTSGTGGNAGTSVHMGAVNFVQPSVTISKGSRVNLIDDVAVLHITSNGSWVHNVAKPAKESTAPTVNNVSISSPGQSLTVRPFNTAGAYHLYWSIRLNMNRSVTVH